MATLKEKTTTEYAYTNTLSINICNVTKYTYHNSPLVIETVTYGKTMQIVEDLTSKIPGIEPVLRLCRIEPVVSATSDIANNGIIQTQPVKNMYILLDTATGLFVFQTAPDAATAYKQCNKLMAANMSSMAYSRPIVTPGDYPLKTGQMLKNQTPNYDKIEIEFFNRYGAFSDFMGKAETFLKGFVKQH